MEGYTLIFLFICLVVLLFLKVPVAYAVGLSTMATLLFYLPVMPTVTTTMQRMTTGIDSFALLAIPFFILAGEIMNSGGIAKRLINFSKSLIGSFPGGLLYVNVISAMFFGAVSGSAAASATAIGGVLGKEMEADGYPKPFSAALNIGSSTIGLIIPPSNVLIIYALASGGTASVEALFMAGYLPGFLMTLAFILVAAYFSILKKFPKEERVGFGQLFTDFRKAFFSLLMIIVVVGGIVKGVFTATEGAVVAVVYAAILSIFYGTLNLKSYRRIVVASAKTTSLVMFLICTSMALSWLFAFNNIPQMISQIILESIENPALILLAINIILLVVGTFMDITPAVLIFTPIFLPIVGDLGVDPVHFGIIMVINLCIGLCTPPVGTLLFIGSGVAQLEVTKVIKPLLPFLFTMIFVLMIVTYVPEVALYLPRLFGVL